MVFRISGTLHEHPFRHILREGRNLIGVAPDCDIRLAHPTVSRHHAELLVEGETLAVTDLGSTNGTFVATRRVATQAVSRGDALAFGHVGAVVEWIAPEDAAVAVTLTSPPGVAPAAPAAPAGSTAGTSALDAFTLERLPALLAALDAGAGELRMAEAAGEALFESLPVLAVEIEARGRGGEGVLFQACRASPGGETGEAVAEGPDFVVRAWFPHANAARVFRPVVEMVATLVRLAAGEVRPAGTIAASADVAMPDPASVVPEVRDLYTEAARIARGDVGVLVCGESGTGKEVLARFLHRSSPRAGGPFVALNCAALPEDLLEAELFGIEKGVATGVEPRAGKFELAHSGTLFLDEIGDMALKTQATILRVLQEGEVYRIGGSVARKARVRIVAATNMDVGALLSAGRFRTDLYYRIATWTAVLPPLRRRKADIPNLAAHFLALEADRRRVCVRGISRAALAALVAYPWPGNIRQLENEMARAVLFLSDGEVLDTSRLAPEIRGALRPGSGETLSQVLETAERDEIRRVLQLCEGDVGATADRLGLGRSTLYRRIKELRIEAAAG